MRAALFCLVLLAAATGSARGQAIVILNHSLARDCFIRAKLGIDPQNPDGIATLKNGVEVCGDALLHEQLPPHDLAATYDNRGVMEKALGRTDEALADFSRAIDADGRLGDTYVNRGALLIAQKKYEPALDDLNKALDLGIEHRQIGYYDRGLAEHMLGRYSEAYYDYKRALDLQPDFKLAEDMLKYFVVTRVPAKSPG